MSLFDDFSQFLETRLEEFLRNNPHLELQALLEQLREQEQQAIKLILDKETQKKRLESEILTLAEEIQTWHKRIAKAKAANRLDLAQPAQEREAALLRQGNQLWGQMEGAKQQIAQTQTLLSQIRQRKQEVQTQATQAKTSQASPNSDTTGWNQGMNYQTYRNANDPLEAEFKRWELDDELEQLKRNL
ncbi:TIGR04376 family protein [Crocosphaera sp. XPORK-15E]|uniref:TIGR04376 family protein n=1 Tax=Crocosphaera sp. XPORK-15E TaxID=3110247 RepID=UPI002B21B35F|nr:TIGR04376 family protein [Crocosphaera sp. XPORK-15E]MEA5534336.1 TIGR04376 family protein [Crocosphaera sp. XPORK-15E]